MCCKTIHLLGLMVNLQWWGIVLFLIAAAQVKTVLDLVSMSSPVIGIDVTSGLKA